MPPLVGRCPERAALCCADCKDLDASCDPWANNGECENNVEYMIGESVGWLSCRTLLQARSLPPKTVRGGWDSPRGWVALLGWYSPSADCSLLAVCILCRRFQLPNLSPPGRHKGAPRPLHQELVSAACKWGNCSAAAATARQG